MIHMVFSSLAFLYLYLPICLLLYFISPNLKAKNFVLMLLSLLFYAWGEPLCVFVMILCAIVNFVCGALVGKYLDKNKKTSLFMLWCAVIISLGVLIVYKYSGLLVSSFNSVFRTSLPVPQIALPIGISFFTFQCLSYTLDVYRGKAEVQKSFSDFLLFVSLFPQLIAGPILRYNDIAQQLKMRYHTLEKFYRGIIRFVSGLMKKVIIANHAGELADSLLDLSAGQSTVLGVWFGVIMYAFQIYFDFSGYSDMAIGLGKMFGFEYNENFNYPYISVSITDFWRRWHISLGTFFRDYVYIPLGGKYKHQIFNIFLVWSLTGIWHGASWNFLLWGVYFGILLTIEKLVLLKVLKKLPKIIGWLYSMLIVLFGWVLFYFTNINDCFTAIGIMFGNAADAYNSQLLYTIKTNVVFVIIAAFSSTPLFTSLFKKLYNNLNSKYGKQKEDYISVIETLLGTAYSMAGLFICTSLLVSSSYNPFLYFRF